MVHPLTAVKILPEEESLPSTVEFLTESVLALLTSSFPSIVLWLSIKTKELAPGASTLTEMN
jgi:hypothetical protein